MTTLLDFINKYDLTPYIYSVDARGKYTMVVSANEYTNTFEICSANNLKDLDKAYHKALAKNISEDLFLKMFIDLDEFDVIEKIARWSPHFVNCIQRRDDVIKFLYFDQDYISQKLEISKNHFKWLKNNIDYYIPDDVVTKGRFVLYNNKENIWICDGKYTTKSELEELTGSVYF